jgi:hypothetical protein
VSTRERRRYGEKEVQATQEVADRFEGVIRDLYKKRSSQGNGG